MPILANEVMTTPVISVGADTSLKDLALLLTENPFSGLPVIDHEEKVVGIVSETDVLQYTRQFIAQPLRDPYKFLAENSEVVQTTVLQRGVEMFELITATTVGKIMTQELITVQETTPLYTIVELMSANNINRIPVINAEDKLTGIITRANIVDILYSKWETINSD